MKQLNIKHYAVLYYLCDVLLLYRTPTKYQALSVISFISKELYSHHSYFWHWSLPELLPWHQECWWTCFCLQAGDTSSHWWFLRPACSFLPPKNPEDSILCLSATQGQTYTDSVKKQSKPQNPILLGALDSSESMHSLADLFWIFSNNSSF